MIWFEVLFSLTAIGWGVWQLIDLKREKQKDAAKDAVKRAARESAAASGTATRP